MQQNNIELSVRDLVEFILRSGDIDQRRGSKNRMQEGSEIHRKSQGEDKRIKQAYQSELYLDAQIDFEEFTFHLSGRADASYRENGRTVLEELKTTYVELDDLTEKEVHKAQLFFYAYLWKQTHRNENPVLELTYIHVTTNKKKSFRYEPDWDDLVLYCSKILEQYLAWARLKRDWLQKRDHTNKKLGFVFDTFRKGQREMSLAIWNTLNRENHLFLQAPTGIGKTVSSIFPAVKKLGDPFSRIFYLTAKNQTQGEAEKTLRLLRQNGAVLRSVLLTAKDTICPLAREGERICDPDHCPRAKGYYDRLNPVLFRILIQEEELSRSTIEAYAEKNTLCPFELSMELSAWSDVIIGDYNYVFDPNASLTHFEENSKNIYLIDEAHNLPDRSREMFSTSLEEKLFHEVLIASERTPYTKEVREACEGILTLYTIIHNKLDPGQTHFQKDFPQKIEPLLIRFSQATERFYETVEKKVKKRSRNFKRVEQFRTVLSEAYLAVYHFLLISEYYGENYVTRMRRDEEGAEIGLLCLDASQMLRTRLYDSGCTVFFSATLNPFSYFKQVLGMDEDTPTIALDSPFNRENCLVLTDPGISTRFRDRSFSMDRLSSDILALIQEKKGKYIIFYPSYSYLNASMEHLKNRIFEEGISEDIELIGQKSTMTREEQYAFINRFKQDNQSNWLVGLCVMGGAFSEGVDLPKEQLIGTVIVSPGIPGISLEREYLRRYYDEKIGDGYNYAYKYPGMNKVLQAAGRVIRTEQDMGVVLFADDRFESKAYQDLFPNHFKDRINVGAKGKLQKEIRCFWQKKEESE